MLLINDTTNSLSIELCLTLSLQMLGCRRPPREFPLLLSFTDYPRACTLCLYCEASSRFPNPDPFYSPCCGELLTLIYPFNGREAKGSSSSKAIVNRLWRFVEKSWTSCALRTYSSLTYRNIFRFNDPNVVTWANNRTDCR